MDRLRDYIANSTVEIEEFCPAGDYRRGYLAALSDLADEFFPDDLLLVSKELE